MSSPDLSPRPLVSYREIILFSLPLLFTTQFMSISHTLINAFLARLDNQVEVLAGFGLGITLYLFIGSLSYANSHIASSSIRGRQSLHRMLVFSALLGAFIALLVFLVVHTGLAAFLFLEIFGVSDVIAGYALQTLICLVPLSLFTSMRGTLQGVLARARRTMLITTGVVIRIVSLILMLPVLMLLFDGVIVGALGLMGGVAVESLAVAFFCRSHMRQLRQVQEDSAMGYGALLGFAAPLMYAMSMQHLGTLLVNGMVAKVSDSAYGLAAFTIVRGFIFLFYGPFQSMQQTVITLGQDARSMERIVRFGVALFSLLSLTLLSVQFLIPHIVLIQWMAIEPPLVSYLGWPVVLTVLYGALYSTGHFLKASTTRELKTLRIGFSSSLKLTCVVMASAVLLLSGLEGNGAMLGIGLLVIGEIAEVSLLLAVRWRKELQSRPVTGS
ncbi:hypothetical protein [Desulfurispira natronophila]|uniref:Na+-driven multidrug efflux pump n=1 Tax=Desulfurispira natronophila TaxID=682562 RepID=A0A7W8DFU5_9BACT|nr:hypothetical protein [Desulfurispira natronophila]MBB5020699.1 Na+-driven multidrug efflux pump [Desulfurispira natronophila]